MKHKMDNFDHIKLKSFCTTKPNATKIRREAENWERIFANSSCDKGLISKIYRELSQMYKNTSHFPIDKWSKDLNREFSEEEIKDIYSYMKKCSKSLLIREMQIKIALRCTISHLSDWLTWQNRKMINVGEDVGDLEH